MNARLIFLILIFVSKLNFYYSQTKEYTRTDVEAKELIEKIYKKLQNGESSFGTAARLYSDDKNSNVKGGEYDWTKKETFSKEFDKVVFELKINEISAPFKIGNGYYIVQVLDKRENEIKLKLILITFNN